MTIMLIMAMLFSLVEMVHLKAVQGNSRMATEAACQSVFADYCRPLFKTYGILAIDGGYGEAGMRKPILEDRGLEYMGANTASPGMAPNYLALYAEDCRLKQYSLLTDDNGRAFLKQAADYQKIHAAASILKLPQDAQNKLSEDYRSENKIDELIDSGRNALESPQDVSDGAAPSAADSSEAGGQQSLPPSAPVENPIPTVAEWKRSGILAQVIGPDQTVSTAAMASGDIVSKRRLNKGNMEGNIHLGPADILLYEAYFKDHFGSYTSERSKGGLHYELEYLVGGKESDEKNLKHVVTMLLAARVVENLAALSQDANRMAEAETIALALSSAVASPELTKAVKQALIAAWAYVESVLDVRLLLSGGKVSLVKSPSEWTSSLSTLVECLDTSVKAKDCSEGIDYSGYLLGMITVTSKDKVSMRAMDILENELRAMEDYGNIRLDNFVYQAEFECEYSSVPVFLSMVIIPEGPAGYNFVNKGQISYIE